MTRTRLTTASDHQTAEVSQPNNESLHLPAALVSSKLSAILPGRFDAVAAMQADQLNAALGEPSPKRIGSAARS